MFCYQEKVNAGAPQVCTPEIWDSLIDSPAVANTCAAIAALDPNATANVSLPMLFRPVSPCSMSITWIIRGIF